MYLYIYIYIYTILYSILYCTYLYTNTHYKLFYKRFSSKEHNYFLKSYLNYMSQITVFIHKVNCNYENKCVSMMMLMMMIYNTQI